MVVVRSAATPLGCVAGALGLLAASAQAAPHVNAAVQGTTTPAAVRGPRHPGHRRPSRQRADRRRHAFFGEAQVTEFGDNMRPGHLFQAVSTDGGKTFTPKMILTTPRGVEFTYLNTPAPAVNPRTGEVYVAWEETGQATPSVQFMASSDGAQTWSRPRS